MRFLISFNRNTRVLGLFIVATLLLGAVACNVVSTAAPTATPTTASVPPLGSQPSPAPAQTSSPTEASPAPTVSADGSATPTPKVAFAVPTDTPTRTAAQPTNTSAPRPAAPTGKIAYSVVTGDTTKFWAIWVANADGSGAHQVIDHALWPAFSPDGKQIVVYERPESGASGLYLMNADGGAPALIVNHVGACCASWSRDGAWIAFTESPRQNQPAGPLKMIKNDGLYKTVVDLKVIGVHPSFSPDGKQVVYSGGELGSMSLGLIVSPTDASGAQHILTRDNGGSPQWSPDGRRIVYHAPIDDQHRQVFVINADGSGKKQLTTGKGNDIQPVWSRDGGTIFYRSDQNGTAWAIFAMNADGTNPRRLIANAPPHPDLWGWESLTVAP